MSAKRMLMVTKDQMFYQSFSQYMPEYTVDIFYSGESCSSYKQIMKNEYCLTIMDAQEISQAGMETLCSIRKAVYIPVLALTDILTAERQIALFEAGADVCVQKSLDMALCAAQIRALVRLCERIRANGKGSLMFGSGFLINPSHRKFFMNGAEVALTRKEFDMLYFFARHPEQVFSADHLYESIWKEDFAETSEETVKAHIKKLRKKLNQAGKPCIHNVWGVGYKFVPPE